MKKILLISNHFYPYKGGLENYVLNLAKGLNQNEYEVDVLTYNHKNLASYENYYGLNIIRLPCWEILGETYSIPKIFNTEYEKIISKILETKYDVVITNTRFFTISFLGMLLAKKINCKYIHTEHGNKHVIHKNPLVTVLAWIYDQTLGRAVFSNANIVVGISKQCVSFAKKMGAKKTKLIYNSINLSEYKKVKTNLQQRLNISPKTKIITYVGRLIYAKGIQDLIQATTEMKSVQLIIIGEGPYRQKLEQLAKETNQKIIFTGELDKQQVIEYLSISDLFVNPSYSEGLPTSVLEAAAIGVPIIATDVGGTREIIQKNLIKPKDVKELKKTIIKVLKEKQKKVNLNKFDQEINANLFEELL
ncbi:hypothetical protein COV13_00230 [Candidatus Woesearchaeota archaeon CG10_big_fil_rev_8_21_14_0_10_32_9]|nr:MAG: hypothetical protein COV13_00230 [Candidatus Woesearchaeota archaeon CG10_big_fil_rev_8_21_14_0_10_32_9]